MEKSASCVFFFLAYVACTFFLAHIAFFFTKKFWRKLLALFLGGGRVGCVFFFQKKEINSKNHKSTQQPPLLWKEVKHISWGRAELRQLGGFSGVGANCSLICAH